jgi:SAM-dependent methyltransferase
VTTVLADARDLSALGQQIFDAVLLMGPLYHLVVEADRVLALQQALAHLRPGGPLFSAFICRYGIMGDLMTNVPDWIYEQADVRSVLAVGKDPDDHPRGGFRGYFADPAEIIPLHETLGIETLALAAVEPCIGADDASYARLEGEQRRMWLDVLETVSTQPSLLGASRHLLYVGRKRS